MPAGDWAFLSSFSPGIDLLEGLPVCKGWYVLCDMAILAGNDYVTVVVQVDANSSANVV